LTGNNQLVFVTYRLFAFLKSPNQLYPEERKMALIKEGNFKRKKLFLIMTISLILFCTEQAMNFSKCTHQVEQGNIETLKKNSVALNTCTGNSTFCNVFDGRFAYVFYISNSGGSVRSSTIDDGYIGVAPTYYEYAKRAITRTATLTTISILILCTKESFDQCTKMLKSTSLEPFVGQIKLLSVDETIWLEPYKKFKVKQKRPKLMHAYGTTQIFNPLYTGNYDRLIFMDLDTFMIRNIDELFCTGGFAAAKRPGVPLFNGGVFVFTPSDSIYEAIMKFMFKYMKMPGEKKFAMQSILHEIFGKKFYCFATVYNCGGFCAEAEGCSKISPKCDITNEEELFSKAAVIHSKIGEPHLRNVFPTLYKLWASYG